MSKFSINIHCIVFGVNETLNKRCILSTDKEEILFPFFKLDSNHKSNINNATISFLKEFTFVNELALIPQIINLNSNILNENKDDTIDMVFGFIIDYNSSIDNSKVFWIDFDPMIEHKFSPIIFETIQRLA